MSVVVVGGVDAGDTLRGQQLVDCRVDSLDWRAAQRSRRTSARTARKVASKVESSSCASCDGPSNGVKGSTQTAAYHELNSARI